MNFALPRLFLQSRVDIERARKLLGDSPAEIDTAAEEIIPRIPAAELLTKKNQNFIKTAGVTPKQLSSLIATCAGSIVLGIAGGLFLSPILILIVPAVTVFLGRHWLRRKVFLRAEAFERDYPAFLMSLAASIKTGMDPLEALIESQSVFPAGSLVSQELKRVKASIERGSTEEEALQSFGASIAHPDLPLFRSAFLLSRREGASLAPSLQRLARVTRARQSFRRKIRAAVAAQRLSSFGILGCAVLIALTQVAMNREAFLLALEQPLGRTLLTTGSVLLTGGLCWMLRLTRTEL